MFEKEAKEYAIGLTYPKFQDNQIANMVLRDVEGAFQKGAEVGYNKANEWHYVKDEGTPIHRGHYLVCLRDKCRSILDCWISFDKDIGWYSLQVRLVDIYAWKEIVLPELPKESE